MEYHGMQVHDIMLISTLYKQKKTGTSQIKLINIIKQLKQFEKVICKLS